MTALTPFPFTLLAHSSPPLVPSLDRYRNMTPEEIQLDRYAKFRKLGLFEEFVVKGGNLKDARAEREQVRGEGNHAGVRQGGARLGVGGEGVHRLGSVCQESVVKGGNGRRGRG